MPVTFDQLVEHVRASLNAPESDFDPSYVAKVGDRLLAAIIRATLKGIDHHINDAGEVYSPAPEPVAVFSGVRQSGVHYKGQKRRRGYRR